MNCHAEYPLKQTLQLTFADIKFSCKFFAGRRTFYMSLQKLYRNVHRMQIPGIRQYKASI